jgi:hypothetical protein
MRRVLVFSFISEPVLGFAPRSLRLGVLCVYPSPRVPLNQQFPID